MLLTITTTHTPARDLGYLLCKHPDRCQIFPAPFGAAHVFYPVASDDVCTAALLLDIDPFRLVRRPHSAKAWGTRRPSLGDYVNERPYISSSLMSVAIAQVFNTALAGRCKERPELVVTPIPLEVELAVVPDETGGDFATSLFAPLGYSVNVSPIQGLGSDQSDGRSAIRFVRLHLATTATLSSVLSHLYVLISVLDDNKHYWVGEDEVDKLVRHGGGWLVHHPQKRTIASRYLRHQVRFVDCALRRLDSEENDDADSRPSERASWPPELAQTTLGVQRYETIVQALRDCGARTVLDVGCGGGRLLQRLSKENQFSRICGMDVSMRMLHRANKRLQYGINRSRCDDRIELLHGSALYLDTRLHGFDAVVAVDVLEHIEPERLPAFAHVIFGDSDPLFVILTTPNAEFNKTFENLSSGELRHPDHRFEWTREEFEAWAAGICEAYGFKVTIDGIGPHHTLYGCPTQMAVFRR